MYILFFFLSLSFVFIISFISFNFYFYFLIKKEKRINNKIDSLFLKMFSSKKPPKEEFRSMYKAIKRRIKESNKIFEQIESLGKYTIIKYE